MIDAVVFRFRFVDRVDAWRQQTEMRKCYIWAARGETGIYRTRAEQLGSAPVQPRMGVIPCKDRRTAVVKALTNDAAVLIQRKYGLAFRLNLNPYPSTHNIYEYWAHRRQLRRQSAGQTVAPPKDRCLTCSECIVNDPANAYLFWQAGVTLDLCANNSINEASGSDLLWRRDGRDTLIGCVGPNTLIGGCGNDSLADGDSLMRDWGADTLQEGGGNETLIGGQGYDLLAGGAGVDTFAFHTGNGGDRIAGYQVGIDRLMIGDTMLPRSVSRFSTKDVIRLPWAWSSISGTKTGSPSKAEALHPKP